MTRGKEDEGTGILGTTTRKLTVLAAFLVAVVGVLNNLVDLRQIILPSGSEVTPAERTQQCLDAVVELSAERVALSQWSETEFHLTGENKCGREVNTHVAFKPKTWTVTIEPPIGCGQSALNNPDCWVEQTLGPGPVNVGIPPPKLTVMVDELEDGTRVDINWILYANDGMKVRTGGNVVLLRDDR